MEFLEIDSSNSSSSSSSSSSCKPCSPDNLEHPSSARVALVSSMPSTGVSQQKRKAGRKKFKETRHVVFKGVRQRKTGSNKWVCEVREPYKKSRIWLGTFPSPEMAARAYDVAVLALRGNSAALNFPDSASILPRPNSSSAKDIQIAALAAAEAFRPNNIDHHQPCPGSCSSSNSISNEKKPNNCWMEMKAVENSSSDQEKTASDYSDQSNREITKVNITNESNNNNNNIIPLFMDEEALFNMPGLLDSMAEGMLLTPPRVLYRENDVASDTIDIDLWGNH